MTLQTSSMELEKLTLEIENRIQHSYLEKFIQKPIIDQEKLFILSTIINHSSLPEPKKKYYIVTSMLVQIALDQHDLVPKQEASDEGKIQPQTKQLTVLAGDYYSGLYYFFLAEIGDFDMIRVLASAIKEINELKMKLYYLEADSIHIYIDMVKQIESLLIVHVAQFIQETSLKDILADWLIIHRLMSERKSLELAKMTPLFENWYNQSASGSQRMLLEAVETVIQQKTNKLMHALNKLPAHYTELKEHISKGLYNRACKLTIKAEEG